ncbi:MAG TPA: WG repeat-containing protein [Gemmataceae bacterium]|nr:WG repeat-containing protein [Gemmataceae bacterium]
MPFCEHGKWGYMDARGRIAIPARFEKAYDFSGGRGYVHSGDGDGFIDEHGTLVFSPTHMVGTLTGLQSFHESLAAFSVGDKWGYFDDRGRVAIQAKFFAAGQFAEGLAPVYVGGKLGRRFPFRFPIGGHWGYADKSGRVVIEPRFEHAEPFSEALALVATSAGFAYIDTTGETRIRLPSGGSASEALELAGPFAGGFARVSVGAAVNPVGFIDKTGTFCIVPQFERAHDFSEGLAGVERGGRWGYVDTAGHVVIAPSYDEVQDFHDGLAAVRSGRFWKYVGSDGAVCIEGPYNAAGDFAAGVARVHEGGKHVKAFDGPSIWRGGSWIYINQAGQTVRTAWRDEDRD